MADYTTLLVKYKLMRDECDDTEEDCHWLDDHRQKLIQQILWMGGEPCAPPTWDFGNVHECECSKCYIETEFDLTYGEEEPTVMPKLEQTPPQPETRHVGRNPQQQPETRRVGRNPQRNPQHEFEDKVLSLLNKTKNSIGRENKIVELKNLFEYLIDNKELVIENDKLFNIVKNQLRTLYYDENLRMAYGWYRRMFGVRMSVPTEV